MIDGLDSAFAPTLAQAQAARAAGIGLWNGYIATRGGVGLYNPWTQADFAVVQEAFPARPIAFASGWDDPVAVRQLADAWGVRLCLDAESGIRGNGDWVQPWLDASGAGLYGQCGVHPGRSAPFHILAWYPGVDVGGTWYDAQCARPAGPVGWQWQNTHDEFGVVVDRGRYDDWFGGADMFTQGFKVGLAHAIISAIYNREPTQQELTDLANTMNADLSNLADLVQGLANNRANPDLAAIQNDALKAQLDGLKAAPVGTHTHKVSVAGTVSLSGASDRPV